MDLYTIAGIDISMEPMAPAREPRPGEVQQLRVCNCEWQAVVSLVARGHGELGYSLEITPLRCVGNRAKFDHDLPVIQPLFERAVPNRGSCMTVLNPLEEEYPVRESA